MKGKGFMNFMAQLALRHDGMILPTPSSRFSRAYNIYELDIKDRRTESNWWTDWGGTMDEFYGNNIELYYSTFLERVNTSEELLLTENSIWTDLSAKMVYMNLPKHPWLYADHETEIEDVKSFLSYALNQKNPSNNIILGDVALTKFETPSFTVNISDNISGVTLSQGFTVDLHNDDGYFEDDDKWDVFNTPVYIRKTTKENPQYEDFRIIRYGNAGATEIGFDNFSIDCDDRFTGMTQPVCDVGEDGKNIPRAYGVVKIKPGKIDNNTYLAATGARSVVSLTDKDGIGIPFTFNSETMRISYDYGAVNGVYDKDNNPLTYTYSGGILTVDQTGNPPKYPAVGRVTASGIGDIGFKYNSQTGVITFNDAESAVINGFSANRIGEVIKDILLSRANLLYNASNVNVPEFDWYVTNSPRVNIVFTGSDVKKAIDDVLKSDMAYFIQQTDMRFTIRKWGRTYATHTIDKWAYTQKPVKDFNNAQRNYFSSCTIKYNYVDKDTYSAYFYGDNEIAAEDRYRKKYFEDSKFVTNLTTEADARALAILLSNRFTFMKQHIKVAVGIDTVGFELLDKVMADLTINGRQFSKATQFIITGINPASDILELEEI
jgi:hypothetical protein